MAAPAKTGARDRILAAAEELARCDGPAHLALDAVAARAGMSKGGLLYHFPAKLDLLEALVNGHLARFEEELSQKQRQCPEAPDSLMRCYLEVFVAEHARHQPPPTGVLAAMVQNPELLAPIKRFKRQMLDRLKANAADERQALILFLALEGLRSLSMCNVDVFSEDEATTALEALFAMVPEQGACDALPVRAG